MAYTQNQAPPGEPRSVGTAYLLWVPSLLGVAGLHRFYTGHWGSGLLWLFTGGLCGVGSVVDLFLIPEQVRSFNRSALGSGQQAPMTLGQSILALARRRGVRGFTFNDAVLELGHSPEAIRPALESLMLEDCLHVANDPEGRVIYREP
ncbi:MAG TPA: NINE protein [Synechococcus sp. UBA8638]|uniref:NINE protein n=1 Tax=Candidatus Synechococcus spongiarum TaxID=431041 RepID=UPI000470E33B|nr:NINE protein [Candidatus Synechococcus spongiarum]HBP54257.1 NINE protein [Synechococcus sp. UBA8638]